MTGCHQQHSPERRSNGSRRSTRRRGGRFCRRSSKAPGTATGYSHPTTPIRSDSQESDRHTSPHRPRWDDGTPLLHGHGHTHARDHGPNGHQFHVGVAAAHDYTPVPFTVIDGWIRDLPDVEPWLDVAIREARQTIADLDATETSNSDALFYTMGYNELRVAMEELLGALESSRPDSPEMRHEAGITVRRSPFGTPGAQL